MEVLKDIWLTSLGMITAPAPTLHRVCKERRARRAMVAAAGLSFVGATGYVVSPIAPFFLGILNFIPPEEMEGIETVKRVGAVIAVLVVVTSPIWGTLVGVILTGALHMAARALGGKGSFKGLLCGICYTYALDVPIFAAGIQMALFGLGLDSVFGRFLSSEVPPFPLGSVIALIIQSLALNGISLWATVLGIMAVRANNSFSWTRSIIVVLIPIAIGMLLYVLLIALMFSIPFFAEFIGQDSFGGEV